MRSAGTSRVWRASVIRGMRPGMLRRGMAPLRRARRLLRVRHARASIRRSTDAVKHSTLYHSRVLEQRTRTLSSLVPPGAHSAWLQRSSRLGYSANNIIKYSCIDYSFHSLGGSLIHQGKCVRRVCHALHRSGIGVFSCDFGHPRNFFNQCFRNRCNPDVRARSVSPFVVRKLLWGAASLADSWRERRLDCDGLEQAEYGAHEHGGQRVLRASRTHVRVGRDRRFRWRIIVRRR